MEKVIGSSSKQTVMPVNYLSYKPVKNIYLANRAVNKDKSGFSLPPVGSVLLYVI